MQQMAMMRLRRNECSKIALPDHNLK